MVIWKFSSCVFPLSSLLWREQFRSSGRGSPIVFSSFWFLFWKARERGVSQCKISARPEIIKQRQQQQHSFAISGN